jgi:hypothetical protein
MTCLNDFIEALRGELQQYGEMLARFDDAEEHIALDTAKDVPVWAKALQEQEGIVALTRRRREQVQRQLACSLSLPQETDLAEVVPLLPRQHQLLVRALMDENRALSARVGQRANEIRQLLRRPLHLLESCSVAA